jgi:hypothetical protein
MICKFVGGKLDGKLKTVPDYKWICRIRDENYYRSLVVKNTFFRDPQKALHANRQY